MTESITIDGIGEEGYKITIRPKFHSIIVWSTDDNQHMKEYHLETLTP